MARAGRKRKNGPRHPNGQLKKPKKKDVDDRVRTLRQPHRRALAHELRAAGADFDEVQKYTRGEEAESPIGRLWAAGHLKLPADVDDQPARDRYDAGNMFAQVVGAYRSVIESPRDVAGSGRGYPCDPLGCHAQEQLPEDERWIRCECRARRRRYTEAYEALAHGLRMLRVELEHGTKIHPLLKRSIAEHQRLCEDEAYVPAAAERRRVVMAVTRVAIHREAIPEQELIYLVSGLEELRQHFGLTAKRRRRHSRNAK
ncbi:hypothetical protein ACVWW6_006051 [Bradyrhizobium sp. USDA 3311]